MRYSNCLLEEDINSCIHYNRDSHECMDDIRECGMFDKNNSNSVNPYIRKPRWYEKYYKKDSFIS